MYEPSATKKRDVEKNALFVEQWPDSVGIVTSVSKFDCAELTYFVDVWVKVDEAYYCDLI